MISFLTLSCRLRRVAVAQFCAWGLLLFGGTALQAAELQVLAHPQGASDSVSLSMARAIFGMRMRDWPDGTPIRVFVLPSENETHQLFCKKVLRVFPHKLQGQWDQVVYSGIGQAPEVVRSPEALLRKVATTPGAVGYALLDRNKEPNDVRHIKIR